LKKSLPRKDLNQKSRRGSSSKGQNCPPTPSLIFLDTPPPLACLHCAATQATVLRDRQILDARTGYPTQCVCCDCETGSACPKCLGEHLEYGPFDGGTDPVSGYADSGERYHCRDCDATGDVDETLAVLVMLPQPAHLAIELAGVPANLPEMA
jgi:hypothetical protein